jgi:hypothetical protein
MRLGTWLGLLALGLAVACGDDSSDDDGSSGSRAVAEALTEGIQFENGLLRTGSIPEASADTVRLSQDDDVLRLAPGGSSLMSLAVENPEEGDPVESTLIQFEDADGHVEVPADESDAGVGNGELMLSFQVEDDICDAFCNKIFLIRMIQAVKLRSGGVSRHLLRSFELDCRQDGDADLCEDADPEGGRDGGSGTGGSGTGGGGTGGSGTGSPSTSRELTSAINQVNLAACMCTTPGTTDPRCDEAPYASTELTCIGDAVTADGALSASASCLEMRLGSAASACTCPDTAGCYGNAIATALAMCTNTTALETALEDCGISTTAASSDAGP